MTNNDILRRIRYAFSYTDEKMGQIYDLGSRGRKAQFPPWLKKEEDQGFVECADIDLATFLNGWIVEKRGKRDGESSVPVPEETLTNNVVFMKIKIALGLKADEVLELLTMADFKLGRHELSAFFRKEGHKHYRNCHDQVLRKFLNGVQMKYGKNSK